MRIFNSEKHFEGAGETPGRPVPRQAPGRKSALLGNPAAEIRSLVYSGRLASTDRFRSALHALDLEEPAWVHALFTEARALLDDGLGTFVYTYRFAGDPPIRLGAMSGSETAPALWRDLGEWGAANAASLSRLYVAGATTLRETVRAASRRAVRLSATRFETLGVADMLVLSGHDPRGFGVFVTLPRGHSAEPSAKQRAELARLSFELLAVVRLREQRRRTRAALLSAAEGRVAERLLEGASDKEIAIDLGVSLSTVSTFVRRTREKLGCAPGAEVLALSPACSRAGMRRRLTLFASLTAAECDIASALLVGSSYAEIAAWRSVSTSTIASQCGAIFRKCGVSGSRALAAALLGRVSGK